jgi:NitT/TauT family transport system ATP-binding protein
MSAYELRSIKKAFDSLQVLDGVDAVLETASVTAILGPSGCGKTTLLNIAAGIIQPDSGSRSGFEKASFSYSFQEPRLLPWLTALDNILFAMSRLSDKKLCKARAIRFLELSGLSAFASLKPPKLSGGMKRRLSLARAFAFPSDILLLDEAFSAVDMKLRISLMNLFSMLLREEKRTVLFVTHDVNDALYLADTILLLSERPAKVIDTIRITMPREERSFGSDELVEQEQRLYRKILLDDSQTAHSR